MKDWISTVATSERGRRFSQWLLFSFMVSLAPLGIAFICTTVGGIPFEGGNILAGGEVLLICFGLAATGIGDIFANRKSILKMSPAALRNRVDIMALYCTFALMVVVAMAAVSYACILMASPASSCEHRVFIGFWSAGLLLLTAISASVAACIGR